VNEEEIKWNVPSARDTGLTAGKKKFVGRSKLLPFMAHFHINDGKRMKERDRMTEESRMISWLY
jgi:hypothetical protein